MRHERRIKLAMAGLASLCLCAPLFAAQAASQIINDVSQLNPIRVAEAITPHSIAEIQRAVTSHSGPISMNRTRSRMTRCALATLN